MVKILFVFCVFVLSLSVNAESQGNYSPDNLRKLFSGEARQQKDSASRLKAASLNADQLRLLDDTDLRFQLPNGKLVLGVMLPNNKLSPAVKSRKGLHPACVTTDMALIKGRWNSAVEAIECDIPQQELAIIQDQKQVSSQVKKDEKKKEPKPVTISKYSKNKPESPGKNKSKQKSGSGKNKKQKSAPKVDTGLYVPPARTSASHNSIGAVLGGNSDRYGIVIGTWAACRLNRPVSSSESGFIEIVLQDSISGRYRTLPAGTVLFANKSINIANKRLEAHVTMALTPDEVEVDSIKARLYSLDKSAGLSGTLVRDRSGESGAAAGKAVLTGVGAVVPSLGGNVAGAVVNSYTNDMVNNERRHLPRSPRATIKVSPQLCLVQIVESF